MLLRLQYLFVVDAADAPLQVRQAVEQGPDGGQDAGVGGEDFSHGIVPVTDLSKDDTDRERWGVGCMNTETGERET